MTRYILSLIIVLATSFSLSAQVTAALGDNLPDRAHSVRKSKLAKERKLDVFNARRFKGFLYAEANYGVVGTFSKDATYAVSAPVTLGLGYRISPIWSVGLRAGQSVYNSDIYYYDRTNKTRSQTKLKIATANVNAHFPLGLRGEAYGGFGAGYQDSDITALEENPKTGSDRTVVRPRQSVFFTGQIGIRYSVSPQLSIQSELTSGLSTFNVGLRYRLR